MKIIGINLTIALLAIFFAFSTLGCDSASKKDDTVKEKLTQAEKNWKAEFDDFKKLSDKKINESEKAIADLKKQAEGSKKKAKADYQKKIAEIEEKTADLKKKMKEFKEDGKDTWMDFKNEFNSDMEALQKSIKDLTVDNN